MPSSQHVKADYSPAPRNKANFNHQGSGANLSSVYSSQEDRNSSRLTGSDEDKETDVPGHDSVKNTMRIMDESVTQPLELLQKPIPQLYSQYSLPFNPNLNKRVAASSQKLQ